MFLLFNWRETQPNLTVSFRLERGGQFESGFQTEVVAWMPLIPPPLNIDFGIFTQDEANNGELEVETYNFIEKIEPAIKQAIFDVIYSKKDQWN